MSMPQTKSGTRAKLGCHKTQRCPTPRIGALLFVPFLGFWVFIAAPLSADELSLACPGQASAAAATGNEVVLIDLSEELSCAITAALDPWRLRVVASRASNLGSSMPSTSRTARRLAQRHRARMVVWLARDPAGFALWMYDAVHDRTVARPVPEPPFDEAIAAALALSVKTVVRMVGLVPKNRGPAPVVDPTAPVSESSRPVVESSGPVVESSEPVVESSEPVVESSGPVEPSDERAPVPAPTPHKRHPAAIQLGAYAGVRFGPIDDISARYAAEGRWTPAHSWPQLWLGFAVETGTPYQFQDPDFEGQIVDIGGEIASGLSHRLGPLLLVAVSGSFGLYVSRLSGAILPEDDSVEELRVNPVFYARPELSLDLGALMIYLQPSAGLWLRRQHYLVQGGSLLHTERFSQRIALGLQLSP